MAALTVTVVVGELPAVVGRGLLDVLREDRSVEIVSAGVGDDVLERTVAQLAPRVVVVRESLKPGLLVRLASSCSATGILLLACEWRLRVETAPLAAGATTVAVSATVPDILDAVHRAARGEHELDGAEGTGVLRRDGGAAELLTPREREVFQHLSADMSSAAIALEMKLNVATVRTHTRAVFRKLGVRSRRELVGRSLAEWVSAEV